jgi:hypothetical protein
MLQSLSKSLHKLVQEKDTGLATTHKAVREKFPYKTTAMKELKPTDHELHSDCPDALYIAGRV